MKLLVLDLGSSGRLLSVRILRLPTLRHFGSSSLTVLLVEDGDLLFQAPRRFLSQTALAPSYAYIFTDHQSDANPVLGVNHSAELSYLFGAIGYGAPPEHPWLSQVMLDYWISFAVSLTPNDGKGTSRVSPYTHVILYLL